MPLAILRSGQDELQCLEDAISYGIVNAGIGHQKVNDERTFETLFEQAKEDADKQKLRTKIPTNLKLITKEGQILSKEETEDLWSCAVVGQKIVNVSGGCIAENLLTWARHHSEGEVFFRIRNEWLWNACYTARRIAGQKVSNDYKPLSWREFRILAAILSSKVNSYGFSFLGWEGIQARACGFHSKQLFNNGKSALPGHCQPLTRQMIRDACNKLEALGFFARCLYSKGKSGGLTAYSFRHPKREDLQDAVLRWSSHNKSFQLKRDAYRASDLEAFKGTSSKTK